MLCFDQIKERNISVGFGSFNHLTTLIILIHSMYLCIYRIPARSECRAGMLPICSVDVSVDVQHVFEN